MGWLSNNFARRFGEFWPRSFTQTVEIGGSTKPRGTPVAGGD
jgi:hypothetical protein